MIHTIIYRSCLVFLLALSTLGTAKSFINQIACQFRDDRWLLSADVNIDLSPSIIDAIKNGITLNFSYEVKFVPIAHWSSQTQRVLSSQQIRFNHITNLYLLTDNTYHREYSFPTLNELLHALGTLRDVSISNLMPEFDEQRYEIYLRLRLQREFLPTALRLSTLLSSDWDVDSYWQHCTVNL